MQICLEERIGKPELFSGRKRELAEFLKWIDGVKEEISKSTAILSRRKTGKTALLERLYNLTFDQHDRVPGRAILFSNSRDESMDRRPCLRVFLDVSGAICGVDNP